MSRSIGQMEQATTVAAATAEEGAAASQQLQAQAESLGDVVDQLAALVTGLAQGGQQPVATEA